jgi:hypothetical protein
MKKCNLLKHMESFLRCSSDSDIDAIIDVVDEHGARVCIPQSSYTLPAGQKDEFRLKYEDAWYDVISKRLSSELSVLIDRSKQWDMNGGGLNVRGSVVDEILHHYEWCREKCSSFVGREDLIEEVMDLIYGKALEKPGKAGRLSRVNGAIVGKSGSVSNLCFRVSV